MQAVARLKYLRMSPRKMRRVAQLVKGKPVEEALQILEYTPKRAAHHLAKTVKSAAANAISSVGTGKLQAEDLQITNIMVDSAPTAKRIQFRAMGRVYRIRKRFCHLTVEVEGEPEPEEGKKKPAGRKKAEKKETGETQPAAKPKRRAKKKTKTKKEEAVEETTAEAVPEEEVVEEEKIEEVKTKEAAPEEVSEVVEDSEEETSEEKEEEASEEDKSNKEK